MNVGKVPIYEPGLEEMVRRNAAEQRLLFTTDLDGAVKKSSVIFIAVGTPQGPNGDANLEHVRATAKGIAKAMDGFRIIVTKSTVPVGNGGSDSAMGDGGNVTSLRGDFQSRVSQGRGGGGRLYEAGPGGVGEGIMSEALESR